MPLCNFFYNSKIMFHIGPEVLEFTFFFYHLYHSISGQFYKICILPYHKILHIISGEKTSSDGSPRAATRRTGHA